MMVPPRTPGFALEKLTVACRYSVLPNHTARRKVTHHEFKQVCLSGIFADIRSTNVTPYQLAGQNRLLVNRSYNPEVDLAVSLDPIKKEPHDIVLADSVHSVVRQKFLH